MNTIMLSLMLFPAGHGIGLDTMMVKTMEECHAIGKAFAEEHTVILNPDKSWSRAVVKSGEYTCTEVKGLNDDK